MQRFGARAVRLQLGLDRIIVGVWILFLVGVSVAVFTKQIGAERFGAMSIGLWLASCSYVLVQSDVALPPERESSRPETWLSRWRELLPIGCALVAVSLTGVLFVAFIFLGLSASESFERACDSGFGILYLTTVCCLLVWVGRRAGYVAQSR